MGRQAESSQPQAEGTMEKPLIHWIVINVPFSGTKSAQLVKIADGETVLQYKAPYATTRDTYQYTIWVYRQKNGRITKPSDNFASLRDSNCPAPLKDRYGLIDPFLFFNVNTIYVKNGVNWDKKSYSL